MGISKEEEQNRLNECKGSIPGIVCTTVIQEFPANIRQVELFELGNLISQAEVAGVSIIQADCNTYYKIHWTNHNLYSNTRIYLKSNNGEICGIGWEKKVGGTMDQLLYLSGTNKEMGTVTEINSNGMTLKFFR